MSPSVSIAIAIIVAGCLVAVALLHLVAAIESAATEIRIWRKCIEHHMDTVRRAASPRLVPSAGTLAKQRTGMRVGKMSI